MDSWNNLFSGSNIMQCNNENSLPLLWLYCLAVGRVRLKSNTKTQKLRPLLLIVLFTLKKDLLHSWSLRWEMAWLITEDQRQQSATLVANKIEGISCTWEINDFHLHQIQIQNVNVILTKQAKAASRFTQLEQFAIIQL